MDGLSVINALKSVLLNLMFFSVKRCIAKAVNCFINPVGLPNPNQLDDEPSAASLEFDVSGALPSNAESKFFNSPAYLCLALDKFSSLST